ncbi:MAG: HD domain-containing protein [Candidatus Micrarchaeota archaeon]
MVWDELEKALDVELKDYKNAKNLLSFFRKDKQVNHLQEMSNCITVHRLGFSDHGRIHARIVALNALKSLHLLKNRGIVPNIVAEHRKAKFEDSIEIVLVASFLHDIGNSINRQNHELLGMTLARDILARLYPASDEITERKKLMVMEAILCHMGNYVPTSIESKLVALADGCDMQSGRARLPYDSGRKDIYNLSALAIDKVRIRDGEKKPIKVELELNSSAGIFQVEEILLKKIKGVQFEKYVEVSAFINSRNETISYLTD